MVIHIVMVIQSKKKKKCLANSVPEVLNDTTSALKAQKTRLNSVARIM